MFEKLRTIVDITLALIAIFFAVKQDRKTAEQDRKISALIQTSQAIATDSHSVIDKTEEIVKSMTTRYVGMFPEDFSELNDLIPKTHQSLSILLDYAGRGHYSDSAKFATYLTLLRARHGEIKKRMILYSSSLTEQIFERREFTEKTWAEMRSTAKYKDFFGSPSCPTPANEPATLADFRSIMLSNLAYYLFELQRSGFEIRVVQAEQSIFTWIADDLDAVVTFRSQREDDAEAAFRTRDTKLLVTLSELFENVWSTASPLAKLASIPTAW